MTEEERVAKIKKAAHEAINILLEEVKYLDDRRKEDSERHRKALEDWGEALGQWEIDRNEYKGIVERAMAGWTEALDGWQEALRNAESDDADWWKGVGK